MVRMLYLIFVRLTGWRIRGALSAAVAGGGIA